MRHRYRQSNTAVYARRGGYSIQLPALRAVATAAQRPKLQNALSLFDRFRTGNGFGMIQPGMRQASRSVTKVTITAE